MEFIKIDSGDWEQEATGEYYVDDDYITIHTVSEEVLDYFDGVMDREEPVMNITFHHEKGKYVRHDRLLVSRIENGTISLKIANLRIKS